MSVVKQNQLDGRIVVELIKDDSAVLNGDEVLKLWGEKVGQITERKFWLMAHWLVREMALKLHSS